MGKLAIVLTVLNGKLDTKMQMESANIAELSLAYVFLDELKEKIKSEIIKLSKFGKGGKQNG